MKKRSIIILLVEPENPDNIGAVCRAMKNMELEELRLVKPPAGWLASAKKMAVSGYDVAEKAKVFASVEEALQDAVFVVGTTRRARRFNAHRTPFRKAISEIRRTALKKSVVILFGKESKGLDNDALNFCDRITEIPASPIYPSINLAQAVMVVAFSLLYAEGDPTQGADRGRDGEFVAKGAIIDLLQIMQKALMKLEYDEEPELEQRILSTLHSLLKRSGLLKREEQMFKGLFRRIQERAVPRYHKSIQTEGA